MRLKREPGATWGLIDMKCAFMGTITGLMLKSDTWVGSKDMLHHSLMCLICESSLILVLEQALPCFQ